MVHMLRPHAEARPDTPALIDEDGATGWAELDGRVNRLVHGLRGLGLGPGDTFSLLSGNRREYFEVMAAAAHAGLACVPVNWHWSADEVAYVLDNSDSQVLVADVRFAALAAEAVTRPEAPELTGRVVVGGTAEGFDDYEDLLAAQPSDDPGDPTLGGPMFYTSGTTGRPKGVRSSGLAAGDVAILELMAAGLTEVLDIPPDGTTLLCGPAYHSAQWAWSFLPLMAGSTVVSRHRFDAAETLDLIDAHGVTNVHLVPTQFIRLLKLPDAVRDGFDGSSLRAVWHGAAPCPRDVKERMLDWWGPVVHEYYGSTEGSVVTAIRGEEWRERPGSVGRCLPMAAVTIRDDEGTELVPGEDGTIWIRNLTGMTFEYHKDPDKTADVHGLGTEFTTGDVGHLDEDGYLFLSDRKIDMIISGGVNIYPAEIEGVLVTHPALADAAVFGVPDEEFGEQVKAAVQLTEDAAARSGSDDLTTELQDHVRRQLAGYKVPRSVDYHDQLPRHPTGKLYKRLLRDPYWEGAGRRI